MGRQTRAVKLGWLLAPGAIACALIACGHSSGSSPPPPTSLESVDVVSSCSYTPPNLSSCPAGITCAINQTYETVNGVALQMDVARPSSGGPFPLVVVIHGGGFVSGDKTDRDLDAVALAQKGYVAASINYRLMAPDGGNDFPAAIEDVRCAVRVLRASASSWNLDPARVGVFGTSAGAVLTGILGTESDVAGLDDPNCPAASQPVAVQAVAPMFGAFDLHPGAPEGTSSSANGAAALWLHQPPDDPAIDTAASSIDHIDAADPPFLLVHGDQDTTIPIAQSQNMRAALQDGGVPATLVTVSDGHAFDPLDGASNHTQAACTIFAFFKRWL